ncbi:NAD-dependent deacetylase hst3, partial [Coemansia nantahalensis]
ELIGELSEYDLKQRPDLLIVIGTSLKIPGIKRMIREMSKCVHSCTQRSKRAGAGKAIFINRDEPPRGWDDVFDYFIAGDADEVISRLPILAPGAETPAASTSTSTSSTASRCSSAADLGQLHAAKDDKAASAPPKRCAPASRAPATPAGGRRVRKTEQPLSQLLPPSQRKVGMSRKPAAKQKDRKLTTMLRVVKAPPSAIAKPKTASHAAPKRRTTLHPHELQPAIEVPGSPLVPPPQCS